MLKAEVLDTIKRDKDLQYALGKIVHKEGSQTIYNWARKKKHDKFMDYRILYFIALFLKTNIESLLTEATFTEINSCRHILKMQQKSSSS